MKRTIYSQTSDRAGCDRDRANEVEGTVQRNRDYGARGTTVEVRPGSNSEVKPAYMDNGGCPMSCSARRTRSCHSNNVDAGRSRVQITGSYGGPVGRQTHRCMARDNQTGRG